MPPQNPAGEHSLHPFPSLPNVPQFPQTPLKVQQPLPKPLFSPCPIEVRALLPPDSPPPPPNQPSGRLRPVPVYPSCPPPTLQRSQPLA